MTRFEQKQAIKKMAERVAYERLLQTGESAEVTDDDTRTALAAWSGLRAYMDDEFMVFYRP